MAEGPTQILGDGNIRWGISNEVVCCLASPRVHLRSEGFIRHSLRYTFRREYLLMYAWLLHQRYALYGFLTEISEKKAQGGKNWERSLGDFKSRIADFQADYEFARITEVPEYQLLYNAIARQFALKEMYKDVYEPIDKLKEHRDDEEHTRELWMSLALSGIAFCGVFSAYIDSYDFMKAVFGEEGMYMSQQICCGIITLVAVAVLALFLVKGVFGKKRK